MNLVDAAALGFVAFCGAVTGISFTLGGHQTRAGAALLWLGIASGTAALVLVAVPL